MRRKQALSLLAGGVIVTGAVFAAAGSASPPSSPSLTNVLTANGKSPGYAPASKLSPELTQQVVAQGSTRLENPSSLTSYYGYDNDVLNSSGQPQMVPVINTSTTPPTVTGEAKKTEPDKNTYLAFKNGLSGADSSYGYGTHFLYQGHEGGTTTPCTYAPSKNCSQGYITRVNLDADAAHRVTLMATRDAQSRPLMTIDGSTWDPWAQQLIYTTENVNGPTYSQGPNLGDPVGDISGSLGRGGYEGVQNDSAGDVWIVEDIGGSNKSSGTPTTTCTSGTTGCTTAKRPNSFVYRFVPDSPGDLAHGKLQALQVMNKAGTAPITFASQLPLNSQDQQDLHTYGNTFDTHWVTIHDTSTDGTGSFDANAAAKAHDATPFKRPENGQFRPGSGFKEFYFDETGDTDATSPENAQSGGWGSIMKLTQNSPTADTGTLTMFYKSDQAHASFDNATFLSQNVVTFVQDMGDTLHTQSNALDSGFTFDVTTDYSNPANQPIRWLAEGRDASATLDGSATPIGFGTNEGDNEITGVHVSDGDPGVGGILGGHAPNLDSPQWRWFYTQQHGDNATYEVVPLARLNGQ
jgi:hypothetical protein